MPVNKVTGLVRDPDQVFSNLIETDSGQVLTKVSTKIQVPTRFSERKLTQLGSNIFVYGLFAIIMEDKYYGLYNVCAMINIDPYKTTTDKVADVTYHTFHFEPGSILFKSTQVVVKDTILFPIVDEIFYKGKVPWYVDYEDKANILTTAQEYAGNALINRMETIDIITATTTRMPSNFTKQYRLGLKTKEDIPLLEPVHIPLTSVQLMASTTTSKLLGNRLRDSIISALVTPSSTVDPIERALRR